MKAQFLYIKKAVDYFRSDKKTKNLKPLGCTVSEIIDLEKEFGFKIPKSYKEYLIWMGNDVNGLFKGSYWFLKDIRENNEYLPQLLSDNNVSWSLPKFYLTFFCHQGYMAAWFELPTKEDDPKVFFFSEGRTENKPENKDTFSRFLFDEIKSLARGR